jgi:hypothetical protein
MRRTIVPISVAGAVLAILECSWFYVANVATLAETDRAVMKEGIFWAGVVFVLLLGVAVSLGDRPGWWKRTAVAVGGAAMIANVAYGIVGRLMRGSPAMSTAPFHLARIPELVVSFALLVGGTALMGLAAGAAARLVTRKRADAEPSRRAIA